MLLLKNVIFETYKSIFSVFSPILSKNENFNKKLTVDNAYNMQYNIKLHKI